MSYLNESCHIWMSQVTYEPSHILYGVATISRLLEIIRLFCKRALQKRLYSAKETCNFKEPTNESWNTSRHVCVPWLIPLLCVPWLIPLLCVPYALCAMTHDSSNTSVCAICPSVPWLMTHQTQVYVPHALVCHDSWLIKHKCMSHTHQLVCICDLTH